MRCNVDLLKLIQLGVTLSDEDGNLPDKCTWQFNFKFDTGCGIVVSCFSALARPALD